MTRVETHSEPPIHDDGECNRGGIVGSELVVAGREAAPVLEAAEGALDQVAQPIGERIEGLAADAPRIVGNHRKRAAGDQEATEGIAVIGSIGSAEPGCGEGLEQGRRERQVVPLPGAQRERERSAAAIDNGVDFGRPAAA
jgi:hypothetical protein